MTMQLIGLALVHSLWEGGIIAALLALAFSITRRSPASVRYVIGMIGLVAMMILPVATVARTSTAIVPATENTAAPIEAEPGPTDGVFTSSPDVAPSDAITSNSSGAERSPVPFSRSLLTKLEPSLPWLVVAWLIGLLFLSARMVYGVARTRRIVGNGSNPSERLLETVSRIANALGITRAVRSLEGTHITVPMVVGWIRPVIVVPVSLVTALTPAQLDMLVAHELAHIRRYDYVANLVQTVLETLLFFHPGVWWLSERIREERENCCDDIALAVCGNNRKAYTAALLALEESRDENLVFSAAASGHGDRGSLLRRAMRLLSGSPAHIDLGARWIAGVITIFAALFTTGPAVGKAADIPIASKLDVIGMLSSAPDSADHRKYASDATRSAPDTVLTYNGGGSFSERWQWAVDRAGSLRANRYWIGYLIAGDATSQMIYQDSDVPVRIGSSYMKGRMRIGDARNLIFTGSELRPLFGAHASRSTAIFLQFERSIGNDRLTRVHLGSYGIPVYFDRAPAIWIDSTSDAESIRKLGALARSERSIEMRRDLISIMSMHRDVTVALPPLVELADSPNEPDVIRTEAVEGIGEIHDPRAVAVLSRLARSDRSERVRREAIEAFESMKIPAASDTLMVFATTLEDSRLRRTAIEALGGQHDEKTAAFLKRLATSSTDMSSRREAVEALAEMHELGVSAVEDLARNARDIDVRREAVESLANADDSDRALDVLTQVVRNDPEQSVRKAAVEAIGEMHNTRARTVLTDLIRNSPDVYLQVEATEALGESADSEADLRALASLAQNHQQLEVRRKALEAYAQHADVRDAVSFLRSMIANDPSDSMKRHALEQLSELDDESGIAVVRELARSSPDARIRRQAVEILSER